MPIEKHRAEDLPCCCDLSNTDEYVIECAEVWPDEILEFDDRCFCLLNDGKTIHNRYRNLSDDERAHLDEAAGVIVELYAGERPMYYATMGELLAAWQVLCLSFGTT